jgi:hypothetical protein
MRPLAAHTSGELSPMLSETPPFSQGRGNEETKWRKRPRHRDCWDKSGNIESRFSRKRATFLRAVTLSSSINALSFPSACTTNRFPSPRCASAIQIVRPLESTADTQPQVQPALLRLSAIVSQHFIGSSLRRELLQTRYAASVRVPMSSLRQTSLDCDLC